MKISKLSLLLFFTFFVITLGKPAYQRLSAAIAGRGLLGNPVFEVLAQSSEVKLQKLGEEIEQYQNEINKLKSEANTLSNQIAQYDVQIKLTGLKISETEERIALLGGRIDLIETSLDSLTKAFSSRASKTYKMARLGQPLMLLIMATDLSEVVSSFHYLQRIQEADRELLFRLETAQIEYKTEKQEQEELQSQLERQRSALDSQKSAKNNLLIVTKNNEKKYQELLAAARAEFEAIQAIIAGRGEETEVGHVISGDKIASVIQGSSCNSSGGHLHFIVSQNGGTNNPFDYLKAGVSFRNCSGAGECSEGDPFNPRGGWEWPINQTIKFTQGYGYTWAVQNTWVGRIYQFHNGIDIKNESAPSVKAVSSGTLYRGSYTGYKSCKLRYVRVDHDDSDLDTFYLHINY